MLSFQKKIMILFENIAFMLPDVFESMDGCIAQEFIYNIFCSCIGCYVLWNWIYIFMNKVSISPHYYF